MRMSISYIHAGDATSDERMAYLFLDPDQLKDSAAVKIAGTVSSGLEITDAGKPKRYKNIAISDNGNARVIRIPPKLLEDQPLGRSLAPIEIEALETETNALLLPPIKFGESQMSQSRSRYHKKRTKGAGATARPKDRVRKVQAWAATDGQVFETPELAAGHQWLIEHSAKVRALLGSVVEDIHEDHELCRTSIEFADGRKLLIDGVIIEEEE